MTQSTTAVLVLLLAAFACCGVHAWGDVGHQTTAYIAQQLLTTTTQTRVNNILQGATMMSVSTWADEVRRDPEWAWSAPLHFINTPDYKCSYSYSRDCAGGDCVAGAIWNFTQQITTGNQLGLFGRRFGSRLSASGVGQEDALKFVIHFLGDIHQPLHVGFTSDRGGNDIKVYYKGEETNLHAVWDEYIINETLSRYYKGLQQQWGDALVARIKTGEYSKNVSSWTNCNTGEVDCVNVFASEGIEYACSYSYECVASGSQPCASEQIQSGDKLPEAYFYTSYPIVDLRIAQGGARLAALLNHIFG